MTTSDAQSNNTPNPGELPPSHNSVVSQASPCGNLIGVPDFPAHYLPRPEDLTILKLLLLSYAKRVAITGTAWCMGVQGIGGIGKTVLATAIARDPDVCRTFPDGIIWVTLGTEPLLTVRQADVGRALGDSVSVYEDIHQGRSRLRHILREQACLLILDDVCHSDDIIPFDALGARSRMLITTRDAQLVQPLNATEHRIYVLNDDQARRLLALWTGISFQKLPTEAHKVTRECGNVPMALALMGAMIRVNPQHWNVALYRLQHTDLDKMSKLFGDYPYPNLMRAIHVSVNALPRVTQKRYLSLAVFPRATAIPASVLPIFWRTMQHDSCDTQHAQNELDVLMSRALLLCDEQEHYLLHDVAVDYIQKQAGDNHLLQNQFLDAYRTLLEPNASANSCPVLWVALPADEPYMWYHLAYHLIHAKRHDELDALLLTYQWLAAKLTATDITALIADYDQRDKATPTNDLFDPFGIDDDVSADDTHAALTCVREALRLSAHIVTIDAHQLPSQLIGRLHAINNPYLHQLLADARIAPTTTPWLCPRTASLTPPGNALVATMSNSDDVMMAVAVNNDTTVAVAACGLTFTIWNLQTYTLIDTIDAHQDRVWDIALSNDGMRAVTASADMTLKVWDIPSGINTHILRGHTAEVWAVAITADGNRIVSASDDMTLKVWDVPKHTNQSVSSALPIETLPPVATLEGHMGRVRAVAITPDATTILSGSDDTTVWVWNGNGATYTRRATLEQHTDWVRAVALTANGSRAISGAVDGSLLVWDVLTSQCIASLDGHSKQILDVAITNDSRWAISASADYTLKVWNIEQRKMVRVLEGHVAGVNGVALTIDGLQALSASYDGTLRVWDIGRVQMPIAVEGHHAGVSSIAITPDGTTALSASHDQTIKIWDCATGTLRHTLHGHHAGINDVVVVPDGTQFLTASYDQTIKVWDMQSLALIKTVRDRDWVMSIAISADGNTLLSGTYDEMLSLWHIPSETIVYSLESSYDGINVVAMLPDGSRALSASANNTITVWDIAHGHALTCLKHHTSRVVSIAITHDSRWMISASDDATVCVWDLATYEVRATFIGHTASVSDVVITNDNRYVISSSADHSLIVWECATGAIVTRFYADHPLTACAVTPDGTTIIAGEETGRLHFLQLMAARALAEHEE